MPETPEEGEKLMNAWMGWLGAFGEALVDGGNPFGPSESVGAGATSGLTGYSIISAESLDDAVAKTAGCPILEAANGAVEVYETISM